MWVAEQVRLTRREPEMSGCLPAVRRRATIALPSRSRRLTGLSIPPHGAPPADRHTAVAREPLAGTIVDLTGNKNE